MAEQGHGHSTAAWTAVGILLFASCLICLSVVVTSWPLAIVGIVLMVVGVAAGKVLSMAGFGASRPDRSSTRSLLASVRILPSDRPGSRWMS
jgi:membrane-bound ClpP family serine protease